jgi:hypothetical protein
VRETAIRRQASAHAAYIRCAIKRIRPDRKAFDPSLEARFGAFLSKYPMSAPSRLQAAAHEAGHFILCEHQCLVALRATINGSSFGRHGWCGAADFEIAETHNVEGCLRLARTWIAGPLAEHIIGNGCATANIGELVGALVFVYRAAAMAGFGTRELWRDTLRETIAIVETFEWEIHAIADMLARRKKIDRWQPSVRKIMERVKGRTIGGDNTLSTAGARLEHKIDEAFMEFARIKVSPIDDTEATP